MTTMIIVQKLWVGFKKYWQYAVLVLTFVFGYLLFKKQNVDITEQLNDIKKRHEQELIDIQKAIDVEKQQKAENEKLFQKRLLEIQNQFELAKSELDASKNKQVKALVEEYSNQPDVLAQKISDLTGFKIILPTEE